MQTAQAELTTAGRRAATELPATHQHLEPRVRPYAMMVVPGGPGDQAIMYSIYFFIAVLLILICGNVGLLLFARAASREADLVVRTALGASRGRIVAQMFAEALVLGGVAAIVGRHRCRRCASHLGHGVSRDQPGPPSLLVRSQPFPARVRRRDRADGGGRRHRRHHAGDENHARHGPSAQADHGRQRRPAVRRRMDRGDRGAGRGHGDVPGGSSTGNSLNCVASRTSIPDSQTSNTSPCKSNGITRSMAARTSTPPRSSATRGWPPRSKSFAGGWPRSPALVA